MADVTVTPLGGGAFRVDDGARGRMAYAVAAPDGQWVFLDGRVYLVERGARGGVKKRRHEDAGLSAPMPATVVKVNVEPGQPVAKGDVLIMLEAMKMELPIIAPRDGRIRSIGCKPGELVQPGIPLVDLE